METHEQEPTQLINQSLALAGSALAFVVERLRGGSWADLPPIPQDHPTVRPAKANIIYHSTPEGSGSEVSYSGD